MSVDLNAVGPLSTVPRRGHGCVAGIRNRVCWQRPTTASLATSGMTGLEDNLADSIARWAAEHLEVRRVWLFGSRAKGSHRPDSDVDIAIELEPVADSEETITQWIAHCDSWEAQLQRLSVQKIDLEWFDPDGSTPSIEAGLNEAKVLVYERAS